MMPIRSQCRGDRPSGWQFPRRETLRGQEAPRRPWRSLAKAIGVITVLALTTGHLGVGSGTGMVRAATAAGAGRIVAGDAAPAAGVGELWMLEAQSLVADRRVAEVGVRAERVLLRKWGEGAAGWESIDPAVLVRLAALREFGAVFARAGRTEGPERELLKWLVGRPEVLETVVLALSETDSPDGVLGVLGRVYAEQGERAGEFAELLTATAVVYDSAPDMTGEGARAPDPTRAARLFAYYVNARSRMRYDPRELPWGLGVFVVETRVGEPELVWALQRYATKQNLRDTVYDVRYEDNPTYTERVRDRRGRLVERNLTARPAAPTLEQLQRSGGTTADQAYFAMAVCRAVGVPSAAITGAGEAGVVRSWLGLLSGRGAAVGFDLEAGRYDENKGYAGETVDPQSYETIGEDEFASLAAQVRTPREDRQYSMALTRLLGARRLERPKDNRDRNYTPPPLVEEAARGQMLLKAVELSPGNRQVWAMLRAAGKAGQLDASQTDAAVALAGRLLAPGYPAYALDVMRDVISWRGSREQLELVERVRPAFARRPDLQLRLAVLRGDLLAASGQEREAVNCWGAILANATKAGPAAVEAMGRIDRLVRSRGGVKALAEAYRKVWSTMQTPEQTGDVEATAWYQIGSAYARVLEEAGDERGAAGVRSRLEALRGTYGRTGGR